MEKKEYIKPSMEAANVSLESHMMSTSIKVLKDDDGGEEMLSNERRGGWGDLWE